MNLTDCNDTLESATLMFGAVSSAIAIRPLNERNSAETLDLRAKGVIGPWCAVTKPTNGEAMYAWIPGLAGESLVLVTLDAAQASSIIWPRLIGEPLGPQPWA